MSKQNKSLLGESQIRRMMGLAGIPAVNESEFMDTYRKKYFEAEEEEAAEDPMAADAEAPEAAAEEPVEGEPAAMEPDAPADEANVETLVQALAQTITDVTGVAVDGGAEAEAAPAEDPMAADPAADPMAADPAAGEEEEVALEGKYKREDDAAAEEEGEEDEDKVEENLAKALAAAGLTLNLDNEEMVAEITKRVAARLVKENKKQVRQKVKARRSRK